MSLEHLYETIQLVQQIANANALWIGVVGFLCGVLVGNWVAIGRDKRKEFNEAALPIRTWILSQIDEPSVNSNRPSRINIDIFESYLNLWRRMRFRKAYGGELEARHKAMKQYPSGEVFFNDYTDIKRHLKTCLPYTNRR